MGQAVFQRRLKYGGAVYEQIIEIVNSEDVF